MKKDNLYHDESMWKGASPEIFDRAKSLRERMTPAEMKLWGELKENKLKGYKFRRQHPIHRFIADFYCHKLKLIIEIDGKYHDRKEQINLDIERSELLEYQGIEIIRFTNEEVLDNIDKILMRIIEKIKILNNKT